MARNTKFFKRQLQRIIKCCIQAGVPSPSQFPTNVSFQVRIQGKDRTIYNVYSFGPRNVVEIKLDSRWFKPKQQDASKGKKSLKRKRENDPDSKNRERGQKRQRVKAPDSRKRKRDTNVGNTPTENQEENCNGNSNGEGEEPTNGNKKDFISNNGSHSAEGENHEHIRPTYTLPLRVKYSIARYALFQIFGHHLNWQRLLHDIESNIADLEWDFRGQKYAIPEDKEGGNGQKFSHPENEKECGNGQKVPLTDDGGCTSHRGEIPFSDDEDGNSHCGGIPFPHNKEGNSHCTRVPFPDDEEGNSDCGGIPFPDGEEGNRHPVLIPFRNSHNRATPSRPFPDDEEDNSPCGGFPIPDGEEGDRNPVLVPFRNSHPRVSHQGFIPSLDDKEDGDQGGDDYYNNDTKNNVVDDDDGGGREDIEDVGGLAEEEDTSSVNADGLVHTSAVAGDGLDEDDDEEEDNDEDEDDEDEDDDDTSFDLITPHLPRPRNDEEWCCICHNCNPEVDDSLNRLMLPCSHAYHPECISKWLVSKNSCPLCRFMLTDTWNGRNSESNSEPSSEP